MVSEVTKMKKGKISLFALLTACLVGCGTNVSESSSPATEETPISELTPIESSKPNESSASTVPTESESQSASEAPIDHEALWGE